jgi:exonuclease V
LSEAEETSRLFEKAKEQSEDDAEDKRSPLLRFRTFPMKTLSVSDLTAGSWCELQHFYTLTRLPGGRKTRTAAMRRGTRLHEKLEREVFTPVQVQVTKREDSFGLKLWNMIQGLRVLRDQGVTREFEVWGMVDGNVVNGIIDGLSYENPDTELQDDVFSSRGSSQTITNSQPYEPSTPGDSEIYITDVKTRNSAVPPRQEQVRMSIIQLFLYHRFLSDMAADRLDYLRVFERYGLNPDEPFSDSFMAQIGAVHEEVFAEGNEDAESVSTLDNTESTVDGDSNSEFVSAPTSPSQLSFTSSTAPSLKYRTLRTLLPLLKHELSLTFPHGAADLGKIVAVEYRYRGRDEANPPPPPPPPPPTLSATTITIADNPASLTTDLTLDPDETDPFQPTSLAPRRQEQGQQEPDLERGAVICTNTFFVEPETLDLFLEETMRWWRGERPPQGVPREEAGFKCQSCEFREECEWRREMDLEALRKARRRRGAASTSASIDAGEGGMDMEGNGEKEGEGKRRRGRPKKGEKEREREVDDIEDGGMVGREGGKRGRGRPRKMGNAELAAAAAAATAAGG